MQGTAFNLDNLFIPLLESEPSQLKNSKVSEYKESIENKLRPIKKKCTG